MFLDPDFVSKMSKLGSRTYVFEEFRYVNRFFTPQKFECSTLSPRGLPSQTRFLHHCVDLNERNIFKKKWKKNLLREKYLEYFFLCKFTQKNQCYKVELFPVNDLNFVVNTKVVDLDARNIFDYYIMGYPLRRTLE